METEIEADSDFDLSQRIWSPINAAQSHVNYWVRLAEARFSKNFETILLEAQLIASEWAVVRELYRPGRRSPVELGQKMGMSKGGMSKLINRLVKKGYVRKEVAEFDYRFRAVELTEFGRQRVPLLAAMEKSVDREFFGPLRGGGRYRLTASLKRILTGHRIQHMAAWISSQSLSLPPDERYEPSDADAFWNDLCKQVAESLRAEQQRGL